MNGWDFDLRGPPERNPAEPNGALPEARDLKLGSDMSQVSATLLMARSAWIEDGLLCSRGLGWTTTSAVTGPVAVVAVVEVPWTTLGWLPFRLQLFDSDGRPVTGRPGLCEVDEALAIEGAIEVTRSPHSPPGRSNTAFVTASFPGTGLQLQPGSYEWRMDVQSRTVAVCVFDVVDLIEVDK